MTIRGYLQREGITVHQFAKRSRVSPASLFRYMSGESLPPGKAIRRIIIASDWHITAHELLFSGKNAPPPKKRRRRAA